MLVIILRVPISSARNILERKVIEQEELFEGAPRSSNYHAICTCLNLLIQISGKTIRVRGGQIQKKNGIGVTIQEDKRRITPRNFGYKNLVQFISFLINIKEKNDSRMSNSIKCRTRRLIDRAFTIRVINLCIGNAVFSRPAVVYYA